MRKPQNLLVAIVLCVAGLSFQPVVAQDDIFRPSEQPSQEEVKPPKPDKPTPVQPQEKYDPTGVWHADSKGHAVCGHNMTVTFTSKTAGSTRNGDYGGPFTARVNGRSLTFTGSYTDFFGNLATDTWNGTFSEDGRTVTGVVVGNGWGNGCAFVMTRQ